MPIAESLLCPATQHWCT